MSTEETGTFGPSERPDKSGVKVERVAKKKPSIENIDVNALQIDETFDGDFDPYNSTGQFLADDIKKKYDDQTDHGIYGKFLIRQTAHNLLNSYCVKPEEKNRIA